MIQLSVKLFRAYLSLNHRALLAGQPPAVPVGFRVYLKKSQRFPLVGSQASSSYAQLPGSTLVADGNPGQAGLRPPAWQQWGHRLLHAAVAEFDFIAGVGYRLLHPLESLREAWHLSRPVLELPFQSQPILVEALLEDHFSYCRTLLAADPTQPLSAAARAELLALHERMTWLLATYPT